MAQLALIRTDMAKPIRHLQIASFELSDLVTIRAVVQDAAETAAETASYERADGHESEAKGCEEYEAELGRIVEKLDAAIANA